MSEPIPESIPTSADPRSRRPVKRARGVNTVVASQANAIDNLFLDPDRTVNIPTTLSAAKYALPPPPEIVANVQGSSAGAGSGEFHVYKASRRREYERLRMMDEEAKKEEDTAQWEQRELERKKRDEEKTRKNRERRNKKKGKKESGGKQNTPEEENVRVDSDTKTKSNNVKKPLTLPQRDRSEDDDQPNRSRDESSTRQENGIVIHEED